MNKKLFVLSVLLVFSQAAFASLEDNLDYDFINSAFSDKAYSNQDFEKVMKQYETKREGFFTKMYKFFDKDKVKYDEAFKKRYENANNQPKRIKDVPEDKPTILISAEAQDYKGNKVDVGYYQVEMKKDENGKYTLELMQGAKNHVATLLAKEISEDDKAPSIVYGRSETLDNGYIKVIYANLDVTLIGYLKIKEQDNNGFEPIY